MACLQGLLQRWVLPCACTSLLLVWCLQLWLAYVAWLVLGLSGDCTAYTCCSHGACSRGLTLWLAVMLACHLPALFAVHFVLAAMHAACLSGLPLCWALPCASASLLLALRLQLWLAFVACFGDWVFLVPALLCCLLSACSYGLPLWLALVVGPLGCLHRFAACFVLAAVACLCGLLRCLALMGPAQVGCPLSAVSWGLSFWLV